MWPKAKSLFRGRREALIYIIVWVSVFWSVGGYYLSRFLHGPPS